MTNRRIFLKSIAPFAAALAIPKPSEATTDQCQFYADRLQEAMETKYGGDWDVTLMPESGRIFGRRLA